MEARTVLGTAKLVTTDEVFVEVLAHYASLHGARAPAARLIRELIQNSELQVVPQTRESFLSGLDLYERRQDKSYSLTDCISMATMRQMGISEVLTADEHFRQEGFTLLPARL